MVSKGFAPGPGLPFAAFLVPADTLELRGGGASEHYMINAGPIVVVGHMKHAGARGGEGGGGGRGVAAAVSIAGRRDDVEGETNV